MKKYLRIYAALLKNAVSYEAQYRRDTWLHLFSNALWLGLLATTVEVIFLHAPNILGWQKEEIYLLTVIWIIADEIYVMFAKHNIENLPNTITDGALDAYLTKPANTLFLVSTKIFLMRSFYRFLIQAGLLAWLVARFNFAPTASRAIIGFGLIFFGALVSYSFALILNTFSFWLMRIDNISEAWDSVLNIGRYPLSILPRYFKIVAFTAVPIAFAGYVQTATLTGKASWWLVTYTVVFAAVLFTFAVQFWNFAIKRYSSASS